MCHARAFLILSVARPSLIEEPDPPLSDNGPPVGLIGPTRPLTSADLASARLSAPPPPPSLSTLRYTHHRLAQLLASGVNRTVAARVCNYSSQRVHQLLDDPAFCELVAHYKIESDEEWADFNRLAGDLSVDALHILQERFDANPDKIPTATLLEAIKTLADRSGHAPINKNVQLNLNTEVGDRLGAARARRREAELEAMVDVTP